MEEACSASGRISNKPFWPVKKQWPDEDHRWKAHVIRCVVGSEPINVDEGSTRTDGL